MTPEQQKALALAAARKRMAQQTGMVEQTTSGINEGIANMLGAPVDIVTGGLNAGIAGVNRAAGTSIPEIQNPVGGADTFQRALSPFISEAEPQTAAQRYGRRIGQEAGATAIPGLGLAAKAQRPLTVAKASMASALGSGTAGQTAREIAPDNDFLDLAASIAGGGMGVPVARSPKVAAPSLQDLEETSQNAYSRVRQSKAKIKPKSVDKLLADIDAILEGRKVKQSLHKPVFKAVKEIREELKGGATINDIEDARRLIGDNVAGHSKPAVRGHGMAIKDEITRYLDNLSTKDIAKSKEHPQAVVDQLRKGRSATNRRYKAGVLEDPDTGLVDRAANRAATAGTGGNEINAMRQNVRRILDNAKLRSKFNEEELQAMRDIVQGTPSTNAARFMSRFSPRASALMGMAQGSALTHVALGGNPMLALPAVMGEGGRLQGERLTRKQVDSLMEMIRNGGPVKQVRDDAMGRGLMAFIAGQTANSQEDR